MYESIIHPFSLLWWQITLTVLLIGSLMVALSLFLSKKARRKLARNLGLFILFDLIFFEFAIYYMGSWDIRYSLPIQYCAIMELCAGIGLITRLQVVYEFTLFLGIIGPLQAIIAPAIPFPGDYFFYDFYLSHAISIFTPIYLTVVESMRPRRHAWWKATLKFFVIALFVFYFDYLTGSNYMYLMEKPPLNHPLLKVGTWPSYLIIWLTALFLWSYFVHLLFLVRQRLCSERLE
ncbi:MAG: TIGR02206 family membrane protein [Chlamydiae bacterium]|nr:TIGR02206 family membrane protein [Chlamydiota bacterium]